MGWVICTCGITIERTHGTVEVTTVRKGGCGSAICRNRVSRMKPGELNGQLDYEVRRALRWIPEVEVSCG